MKILFDKFEQLKITTTTVKHKPVFNVVDAHRVFERYPAFGQCKNLFLKDDKKQLWLLVAIFDTQIQLKKLAKKIAAPELRFAKEQQLLKYLGVTPGSVTPFGLINDTDHEIKVILDARLFEHNTLGFHPLTNDATTMITPVDLQTFISSCGNSTQIIDFQLI